MRELADKVARLKASARQYKNMVDAGYHPEASKRNFEETMEKLNEAEWELAYAQERYV